MRIARRVAIQAAPAQTSSSVTDATAKAGASRGSTWYRTFCSNGAAASDSSAPPERSEEQRDQLDDAERGGTASRRYQCQRDVLLNRLDVVERDFRIERLDHVAYLPQQRFRLAPGPDDHCRGTCRARRAARWLCWIGRGVTCYRLFAIATGLAYFDSRSAKTSLMKNDE